MFAFVFFYLYGRVREFIVLFYSLFDYVLIFCVCVRVYKMPLKSIECNSKLMGKIKPVNGTMTQPSEYRTDAITKPTENAAKKCNFWTPIFDMVWKNEKKK